MSIKAVANRLGFNVSARSGLETNPRKVSLEDIEKFFGHVAARQEAFSLDTIDLAPIDMANGINDTL